MRQLLPVVRSGTRVERHSRVRSSENPEVDLDHGHRELRYRIASQATVSPMARISLRFVGLFVTWCVAVRRSECRAVIPSAAGFGHRGGVGSWGVPELGEWAARGSTPPGLLGFAPARLWHDPTGEVPVALVHSTAETVRATATGAPSPGYVVDLYVDVIELRAGQPRRLAPDDRPDGIRDAMKGWSEGHDEPYR